MGSEMVLFNLRAPVSLDGLLEKKYSSEKEKIAPARIHRYLEAVRNRCVYVKLWRFYIERKRKKSIRKRRTCLSVGSTTRIFRPSGTIIVARKFEKKETSLRNVFSRLSRTKPSLDFSNVQCKYFVTLIPSYNVYR